VITIRELGNWVPAQVTVTTAPSTRAMVPAVEEAIERAWAEASARLGPKLFDGPMCRLERLEASPTALALWVSPTSYKPFLGTNLTNPDTPPDARANGMGLSTALVTRDGWLMLGRRNASVAYYPNRVHPFAGSLEPRDIGDIFDGVRRELAEELRFTAADVAELRCIGIVEDARLKQPEIIFAAQSTRRRSQIESMLDDAEHHACVAVAASPEAVETQLIDTMMTPVAVGTLALWGRLAFGDAWFASVRPSIETPA
jgi:hypothetical protein